VIGNKKGDYKSLCPQCFDHTRFLKDSGKTAKCLEARGKDKKHKAKPESKDDEKQTEEQEEQEEDDDDDGPSCCARFVKLLTLMFLACHGAHERVSERGTHSDHNARWMDVRSFS